MKQSTIAKWLKVIAVVMGVIGAAFFFGVIPDVVKDLGRSFPEFEYLVFPCLIAIWISAIPCYICLFEFWKICSRIGTDACFYKQNASSLRLIAKLAVFDTVLCFAVMMCLCFANACNAGVFMIAFCIMITGIAIAAVSVALSNLALEVCKIIEEKDETMRY